VAPKPIWKTISAHDIKYEYSTLADFLAMIRRDVPEGTKDKDILIEVDTDSSTGYYDDIIVDVKMKISINVSDKKDGK
jgi:hypothetical protein